MPEPTIHRFERLTPLEVDPNGLKNGSYLHVKPGDAVIAFSIRELFTIKSQIDRLTPYKAAMIYGSLPPLARRKQAAAFNKPGSGYEVCSLSESLHLFLAPKVPVTLLAV
jgi:ATP-dependent RNA helicase SUPV3L1/SUV3